VTDVREALSHVVWIGGGPQSGKTTLSRLLAGTWDLKIYDLDRHLSREHRQRAGPHGRAFGALSMDRRWATPSIEHLVERTVLIWKEVFELVIEDLLALPRTRTIIAEGPGAPPWLVANVIGSPRQAIFLVPTQAQRDRVEGQRFGPGQVKRFPGIVDRGAALANVRARDAILDRRIAASCDELGLRHEVVDGADDVHATLTILEDHFRPFLPTTPKV
jgi:hypothetical protein